ncbi:WRKY transcription factor 44-like protein [Corchorus olitorius]|uniref:WRKY transcription factor 44-like protein n=1 Tax=Corchorus olitorius TaxID=93759 RepID=A0A1R3KQ94_9ROSI|nr:WRKY transcription factor 44-like protein [Corchorus olitorius]
MVEGDDESVKIWTMRACGYCVREIMEGEAICRNFQCEFLRERELSNGKSEWEDKSDLQGVFVCVLLCEGRVENL